MNAQGVVVRALLNDGNVRVLLVEARELAEHTRRVHDLGPSAALLGAQAVVALALSSAHIKGGEEMTLQVEGNDPRCAVFADVTSAGELRVRVTPSTLQLGPDGALTGIMVSIKRKGLKELYRGITEVRDHSLEQALVEQSAASAQLCDVLKIGIRQKADGTIVQAGGVLIERIAADDRDLRAPDREAFLERYGWVADADAPQLLTQLAFGQLGDETLDVLARQDLSWACRCDRQRVEAMLRGLGPNELLDMADEDSGAEVSCDFCGTAYAFDDSELRRMAEEFTS